MGDLYSLTVSEDGACRQPVTVRIPMPEEYTAEEHEVIQLVAFLNVPQEDGSIRRMPVHLNPDVTDGMLVATFVPAELMDDPYDLMRASGSTAVNRSCLHIEFSCFRGFFGEIEWVGLPGGHFKIYMSYNIAKQIQHSDQGQGSAYEDRVYKHYLNLTNCLEDAYSYYYETLGFACHRENLFPLPVYIEPISEWGLFKCNGISDPHIILNLEASMVGKPLTEGMKETVYHELFHAVQYGYGHSINWSYSPFWEATATYFETAFRGTGTTASENFASNVGYAYDSLFGNYGYMAWRGSRIGNAGYGRAGLVHYLCQKKGGVEWMKPILERGSSTDDMAAVLSDYPSWAENYYRQLTMGRIPCCGTDAGHSAASAAAISANKIRSLAKLPDSKIGKELVLTLPAEKELDAWYKKNEAVGSENDSSPLVLGECSLTVSGCAAQIAALTFDAKKFAKLPENVYVDFAVEGGDFFHATPIRYNRFGVDPEMLEDLTGITKPENADKALFYEILLYSKAPLNEQHTARVQMRLNYVKQEPLSFSCLPGTYKGTVSLKGETHNATISITLVKGMVYDDAALVRYHCVDDTTGKGPSADIWVRPSGHGFAGSQKNDDGTRMEIAFTPNADGSVVQVSGSDLRFNGNTGEELLRTFAGRKP